MNFWNRLKYLVRGNDYVIKESRAFKPLMQLIQNQVQWMDQNTQNYIDEGYLLNEDVYSVVEYVARKGAGVDWKLLQQTPDGEEEITDHKILDIIERPNPNQGKQEFFTNAIGNKLVTGNDYWHLPKLESGPNQGQAIELWVLPPQLVRIVAGDWRNPVKAYQVGTINVETLPPEEVLHRKFWNPDWESNSSQLYGLSPWRPASRRLTRANDTNTTATSLIENQGAMGMMTRKDVEPGEGRAEGQMEQLDKKAREKYSGPHKSGRWIWASGDWQWIPVGMNAVDMQIMESEKQDLRKICNVLNLNSALFNDPDNKVYNNVKEAKTAAWYDAIIPELNDIEAEMNRVWVPAFGENLKLKADLSNVTELQEDENEKVTRLAQAWWLTPRQKIEQMGMNPPEGDEFAFLDDYFFPVNFVQMSDEDVSEGLGKMTEEEQAKWLKEYAANKNGKRKKDSVEGV